MNRKHSTATFLVALTVLGLVGPALIGAQPTAGGDASVQSQPTTAACDYAGVYNETIGSVVLIRQEGGQGSGFVYEAFENGTSYVVTNQHVLGDAGSVEVSFHDGETRTGTVVGTAAGADLGVVRVNDTPEYAKQLSLSTEAPQPGVKVAALGSPFGLRGSITQGIVSSTDRAVPTESGFLIPDVIQTDAPINPGNSGGPLVTCDGDVVGVNTAGLPAERAENIGFAVSASLIDRVVPDLIKAGEFAFPYLGVETVDVTPAIAEANDLNASEGVVVVATTDGGPADGVLRGPDRWTTVDERRIPVGSDVVVAIEDTPIRTVEDLSSFLATRASPGDVVELTIIRDGERQTVTVTLGERPPPETS